MLVLAKIAATALILGWGGSGGVFAPCLVIGSFIGLLYHHIINAVWPSASWAEGGFFALLGMDGRFAGMISKATLLDKYRRELMARAQL